MQGGLSGTKINTEYEPAIVKLAEILAEKDNAR
jgi:hypothetical protein